jgi:adenosine deaminase
MDLAAVIKALPKVEQHVHLVGSIRPETLLWLVKDGGLQRPFETVQDVRRFFQYRDFPHFIEVYKTVFRCLTREDQFERITYELLEDEAKCHVAYVEASFSAPDHVRAGLDYELMLDAINRGIRRAQQDFGIQCNLRIDLVRNYGPANGMQVLDWIQTKSDNVVSIDLGGSEEQFPPQPFAPVYQRAKTMGLHLVAHAGEAAGPDSIRAAVDDLKVERIGHGVTAQQDPALVEYLRQRGITIEMCPTSNVCTGVVPALQQHPIRPFFDRGLAVTVNSDDPTMFNTNMNHEYLQLHQHLDFTVAELFQLTLNALHSSFLPDARKTRLRTAFAAEYHRLTDPASAGPTPSTHS